MNAIWPTINTAPRDKAAEKRERKRKKYAELRAENLGRNNIKMAQEAAAVERVSQQYTKERVQIKAQLDEVHAHLRSADFRTWYEATTGDDVAEFLAEVILSTYEYSGLRTGIPQLEWTQHRIEYLVRRNPWTNPEAKALWADELKNCRPTERRRILVRLATPRWSDQDSVMAIYKERDRISAETGIPHEVDHIYPIVSHIVCGLHVHFNLRVIPKDENRSKSNKFPEQHIFID